MARSRAPSPQTLAVLDVLSSRPQAWRYGYDLIKETGLKSGTLYPLLMRLSEQGLLESEWLPSTQPGRPARHAYRLTSRGLSAARAQSVPASAGLRVQTA